MKYILIPYDRYEMMLKTEKKSRMVTSSTQPQLVHQSGSSMDRIIPPPPRPPGIIKKKKTVKKIKNCEY
jgi:hypothetical protein